MDTIQVPVFALACHAEAFEAQADELRRGKQDCWIAEFGMGTEGHKERSCGP